MEFGNGKRFLDYSVLRRDLLTWIERVQSVFNVPAAASSHSPTASEKSHDSQVPIHFLPTQLLQAHYDSFDHVTRFVV